MFDFPKADRKQIQHYKGNYLRSVIIQCKFSNCDAIVSKKDEIYNVLKDLFPRRQDSRTHSLSFVLGKKEPSIPNVDESDNGLELKTENGHMVIGVNKNNITLTISGQSYTNFNESKYLITKFEEIFKIAEIKKLERSAIRKINIIPFDVPVEDKRNAYQIIPSILNPMLYNNLAELPGIGLVRQNFNTLNYRIIESNYNLNLKYGYILSDSNTKSGNIILDIDLFSTKPSTKTSKLISTLTNINHEIFNIFNWAIREDVINFLK